MQRLGRSVLLLVCVSLASFLIGRCAPGEFFDDLRLNPQMEKATVDGLRARYGIDKPATAQYLKWISSAASGDFGFSLLWQRPVAPLLRTRIANTLQLTVASWFIAWALAVPAGMLAAHRPRRLLDHALSFSSISFMAVPELVLTLGLMLVAVRYGWAWLLHSPAIAVFILSAGLFPVVFFHVRSAVLEAINSVAIRSARACGIRGRILWLRYVSRLAANPLISLAGVTFGSLVGASLLVETLLGRPGIGPLFVSAVEARDLDLVTATMLLSASILTATNLGADVLLAWNDPRVGDILHENSDG